MGSVSILQSGDPNYQIWEKGNILPKVSVYDTSGITQMSGNQTLTMDFPMREIFISNDSNSNLTAVFTGIANLNMSFLLLPGETINERLPLFNQVVVTCSGLWRYYVRSGRVA